MAGTKTLIADLTGCFRGKESRAVELLPHTQAPDFRGTVLILFEDQSKLLAEDYEHFERVVVEPSGTRDELFRTVISAIERRCDLVAPGTDVELISFVSDLEVPFLEVCRQRNLRGTFKRWGLLFRTQTTVNQEEAESRAIAATGMSREEIVTALRRAMDENPTGVKMTYLRDYLQPAVRFSRSRNPSTAFNGFVKGVVGIGQKAGVVRVEGEARLGMANVVPAMSALARPTAKISPIVPATSTATGVGSADIPPKRRRVDVFLEALRKQELGPFSRDREFLLGQLEELLQQGGITPALLFVALKEKCKKSTSRKTKLPWGIIERFLYTLSSRVPILVGEKEEVLRPNDVSTLGRRVIKLAENCRDLIDRELLRVLIEEIRDINTGGDLQDLAFVLYPEKEISDAISIVELHLQWLQENGRIEREGNFFCVKKS
jgi:hypothetical protein